MALGILKKLGFHADAVVNGLEAVHALESLPYDLVLMDCQMPEMDGYEATHQIRTRPTIPDSKIPIIALTANAMRGDRKKCLEAGMDDYIPKPVDPGKLIKALEKGLFKELNSDSEGIPVQAKITDTNIPNTLFARALRGLIICVHLRPISFSCNLYSEGSPKRITQT